MGKIQRDFSLLGFPGAISRSVDDIVISMRNADQNPIKFGKPVFLAADGSGAVNFINNGDQTADKFIGIAVRNPAMTPYTYPGEQDYRPDYPADQYGEYRPGDAYLPGDVVEILVRGCVTVQCIAGFPPGRTAYIRKSDGSIVPGAGASGTTIQLTNMICKTPQKGNGSCSEFVLKERNIL